MYGFAKSWEVVNLIKTFYEYSKNKTSIKGLSREFVCTVA